MEEETKASCCKSSKTMKFVTIMVIVVCLVGLGVISLLRERIVNPTQYTVSFSADAKTFAKPDIGQITVAVKTDRMNQAVGAVKANTEKMNKVIAKLKDLGIEEKDIKTTNYRLNPVYDYIQSTGRSVLGGYEVYQEVTIKIRNLDKIGEVIEATTTVGANQVGNVAFTIDDPEDVRKVARAEAVAKAQRKAEEMVKLTGIKLGKLVNVYESTGPGPVYDYRYMNAEFGGGGVSASPEIQVGENEVRVEVTLVYQVR